MDNGDVGRCTKSMAIAKYLLEKCMHQLIQKTVKWPTIALNGYNIPWNPLGTVYAAALHLSYFITKGSLDGSFKQSKNCKGEKSDKSKAHLIKHTSVGL